MNVIGNVPGGLWIGLARPCGLIRRCYVRKTCSGGFKRLEDDPWDAWLRADSANLGVSLDRDALANLGLAELDDIVEKRVADMALRRRRRKSSNQ